MIRLRPAPLLLALALLPGPAAAQFNIFGSRSDDAPVPPGSIPGAAPRAPAPQALPQGPSAPSGVGSTGGVSAPAEAPAPPPPPKPMVLRAPTEDAVLNQELKLNGRDGSFRLERIGPEPAASPRPGRSRPADAGAAGAPGGAAPPASPAGPSYRLRLTLAGSKVSEPTQTCTVPVSAEPAAVESQGKPDGVPRFELKGASCPISFDVLDGAVWVRGPAEACTFEAQDCRADPRGLWGPEPGALFAQAKNIETARGVADRAVRENYKVLTSRAKPQEVRPVVQEQAAFSSERETLCRGYAREAAHGFCNTRFTEARAVSLATRLGALTPTAVAAEETPRPRPRPRPTVAVAPPPEPPPQQPRPFLFPFFR